MSRTPSEPANDPHRDAIVAAISRDASRLLGEGLSPGLYLVATPIGNLGDITLRALAVLARADVVYCEDTRHSSKLFQHFAIRPVTRPFHEHNEDGERDRILRDLNSGKRVAIISDAGTPLISDPGFKLVRACREAGIDVFAIPGASAVLCALSASGLPTDAFCFAGFLPPKTAARRAKLASIKGYSGSVIVFEAPQRLADALRDMADVLGDREASVARELTKLHDENVRGRLSELADHFGADETKGEIVIVIGPALPADVTDDDIASRLSVARQTMSLKDAAKAVADALDVPKARVYALGLKVQRDDSGTDAE